MILGDIIGAEGKGFSDITGGGTERRESRFCPRAPLWMTGSGGLGNVPGCHGVSCACTPGFTASEEEGSEDEEVVV